MTAKKKWKNLSNINIAFLLAAFSALGFINLFTLIQSRYPLYYQWENDMNFLEKLAAGSFLPLFVSLMEMIIGGSLMGLIGVSLVKCKYLHETIEMIDFYIKNSDPEESEQL